jgi:hypothetical protein
LKYCKTKNSGTKTKWWPFLHDGVLMDTPKNTFAVTPQLAKAPVKKKKLSTKNFDYIYLTQ